MDVSCRADGVNIPVREDFGAVASVTGFLLPLGKISQKIQTGCNAFDMFLR